MPIRYSGNAYINGAAVLGCKGHHSQIHRTDEVAIMDAGVDKVFNTPYSNLKAGLISIRTVSAYLFIHASGRIQNEADIVVGFDLLAFGHAAGIACGHCPSNAIAAGDSDCIVSVADGPISIVHSLYLHLQRYLYCNVARITVGIFRLEGELELIRAFSSFTGDSELFVLFHGPVAVLVQRGSEKLITALDRPCQDGFAGSAFTELHIYRALFTIDQDSDGTGGAIFTQVIYHAAEVELDIGVLIVIGKSVCTGLCRHLAFIDDDGIVALGDEIDALDGKVAVLVPVLVSSVVYGGDDHLVETAQYDI